MTDDIDQPVYMSMRLRPRKSANKSDPDSSKDEQIEQESSNSKSKKRKNRNQNKKPMKEIKRSRHISDTEDEGDIYERRVAMYFVCPKCSKTFSLQHQLTWHIHTDCGTKKYRCYCCEGNRFATTEALEHHLSLSWAQKNDKTLNGGAVPVSSVIGWKKDENFDATANENMKDSSVFLLESPSNCSTDVIIKDISSDKINHAIYSKEEDLDEAFDSGTHDSLLEVNDGDENGRENKIKIEPTVLLELPEVVIDNCKMEAIEGRSPDNKLVREEFSTNSVKMETDSNSVEGNGSSHEDFPSFNEVNFEKIKVESVDVSDFGINNNVHIPPNHMLISTSEGETLVDLSSYSSPQIKIENETFSSVDDNSESAMELMEPYDNSLTTVENERPVNITCFLQPGTVIVGENNSLGNLKGDTIGVETEAMGHASDIPFPFDSSSENVEECNSSDKVTTVDEQNMEHLFSSVVDTLSELSENSVSVNLPLEAPKNWRGKSCSKCRMKFVKYHQYKWHMETDCGSKAFRCYSCNERCATKLDLYVHVNNCSKRNRKRNNNFKPTTLKDMHEIFGL